MAYIPERGDFIWISFNPQAGHEQAGRRPALVLSPSAYNGVTGLAICCPVTSQMKGYTFEVAIPEGLDVSGVVLSDQIRNLDWEARQASFLCEAPPTFVDEVLMNLGDLLTG